MDNIKTWQERMDKEGCYEVGGLLRAGWMAHVAARDAEIADLRAALARAGMTAPTAPTLPAKLFNADTAPKGLSWTEAGAWVRGWNSCLDTILAAPTAAQKEGTSEQDAKDAALRKINEIRNSIIGIQKMNWSEHVYPLVAALDEAGYGGMPYPEARTYYGSLIERATKAEDALAAMSAAQTHPKDTTKGQA